jgi:hypothetical protein
MVAIFVVIGTVGVTDNIFTKIEMHGTYITMGPCMLTTANKLPYSRKTWRGIKFGGLADQPANRQIKIHQY